MRQPTTKVEKIILGSVTAVAGLGLLATAVMYLKAMQEKPWPDEIIIEAKACVAGGYQRSNDTYVMDIFIPGRGVETIEDLHQSSYDLISETLGVCG